MRNVKLLVALLLAGCAGAVPTRQVQMDEVHRKIGSLTGLDEVPLDKEKVVYLSPGKGQYDEFFKASAEMRGGLMLSEAFSGVLTQNVKAYARSYAAARASDQNVKEIVGGTSLDQLSEDQSFALLGLKKKRGELQADELKYFASSATNAGQMVMFLNKAAEEAGVLADRGNALSNSVKEDFAGPKEMAQAPTIARGLSDSMAHIKEASAKAPPLAKTITRLGQSLKELM